MKIPSFWIKNYQILSAKFDFGNACSVVLQTKLEPAVHGMGAPTGILEERESSSDPEILAQCPDLGRRVASGEAPGDTPRGRFPKMSVQN